jgi:nucleoside-diphosphate-sugar epimerase
LHWNVAAAGSVLSNVPGLYHSADFERCSTFDLPFTIIRPNYFYQNDAALRDTIVKTGVYPVPLGTTGISPVDIRDIAEAAAISLTGNDHLGKSYNLVGPDILSSDKVASIWSEVLGKRVCYGGHDMDAFEQEMRKMSKRCGRHHHHGLLSTFA